MLWVDDGLDGLGATTRQKYTVKGMDYPCQRLVNNTCGGNRPAEKNYPKVDGESL